MASLFVKSRLNSFKPTIQQIEIFQENLQLAKGALRCIVRHRGAKLWDSVEPPEKFYFFAKHGILFGSHSGKICAKTRFSVQHGANFT